MHTYTLSISKEDCLIEFKSYDPKIVEKELKVWINLVENFLEENPTPPEKQEITLPKIELGSIVLEKKSAPPQEQIVEETPYIPTPQPAKKDDFPVAEKPQQRYKISAEAKKLMQKAIHKPLPKMNEVLKEETPPKPTIMPQIPQVQKNPAPVIEETYETVSKEHQPTAAPQDFASIYNQRIAQENNSTDRFAQLLSLSNIHNKLGCLVACAYHLVERENFERFTLKQINTLSKALLEESIEHDTIKEALENRFIKIVPDYTGIATTMEYTLTEQGVQYFKDVIAE